ncbi:MAG: hypothetical protein WBD07_08360 [Vicinamibacterales bacterium]
MTGGMVRLQVGRLWVLAALVLALAGCAPKPEEPLLTEFFAKSQARDTRGLQRIATVVFDPRTNGVVTSFSVESVALLPPRPLGGDAQMLSKNVTIAARVQLPSGDNVRKTLVVRLQQAVLRGGQETADQWQITAVQ